MLPHGGHFTKEHPNLDCHTNKVMYVDISDLINKLNKINNTEDYENLRSHTNKAMYADVHNLINKLNNINNEEGEDFRSPTDAVNLLRRTSNV